jgi:hypothetical protein
MRLSDARNKLLSIAGKPKHKKEQKNSRRIVNINFPLMMASNKCRSCLAEQARPTFEARVTVARLRALRATARLLYEAQNCKLQKLCVGCNGICGNVQ